MSQTGIFQTAELKETCAESAIPPPNALLVLSIIGETNAAVSKPAH